jgi:hypothetical protein
MGRVVHGASCPWGKLSVGQAVHGELSMGPAVHKASSHGASCHRASSHGASCHGASSHGASCQGANFDGASFDGASCPGITIRLDLSLAQKVLLITYISPAEFLTHRDLLVLKISRSKK